MGINLDADGKFMGSRTADYQALKTAVRTELRRVKKQGTAQLQSRVQQLEIITQERDGARQLVTQLTDRAVNAEQQVKSEKRRADRAVKKLEETKKALTIVRVRSEEYRRMSTEYAKFQKVTQERDAARQLVSKHVSHVCVHMPS